MRHLQNAPMQNRFHWRSGVICNLAGDLSSVSFSGLVELHIRIQKGVLCDGHIEKEVYLQRNKDKEVNDDLATSQL